MLKAKRTALITALLVFTLATVAWACPRGWQLQCTYAQTGTVCVCVPLR